MPAKYKPTFFYNNKVTVDLSTDTRHSKQAGFIGIIGRKHSEYLDIQLEPTKCFMREYRHIVPQAFRLPGVDASFTDPVTNRKIIYLRMHKSYWPKLRKILPSYFKLAYIVTPDCRCIDAFTGKLYNRKAPEFMCNQ